MNMKMMMVAVKEGKPLNLEVKGKDLLKGLLRWKVIRSKLKLRRLILKVGVNQKRNPFTLKVNY